MVETSGKELSNLKQKIVGLYVKELEIEENIEMNKRRYKRSKTTPRR
jgi:hypothetical protein